MVKRLESKCKNAKVYFRIQPMVKLCWEHVKILDDLKTLYVRCRQDFEKGKESCEPSYWTFETDGVFYNNSQSEIYYTVAEDILDNITTGQNAIILCFGQTGTGKSLTSSGIANSYDDRGIIPRLISNLFITRNENRPKYKMCFKLSYIEATRVYIRDLLKDDETLIDSNSLKEISAIKCDNEKEMLKAIFKAEGRKTLAKNTQYQSHAANSVLTITIISKLISDSSLIKTCSKIHIVDLAGADTVGNETCLNKTSFDIGTANLAKTQLEQFLLILIENIPEHIAVTQRLNVLIHYLRDSLSANSLLRFIGHIRIEKEHLLITLSMLRFGQIVRGLKMKKLLYKNYEDSDIKIKSLQAELKQLQQEQAINSMLLNEDLKGNVTPERMQHMKTVAEEYLHDKINELTVINVTDVNTVLQVFKQMFLDLENEKATEIENIYKKAYDDAMMNLKLHTKTNKSHTGSKRGSLKSKESITASIRTKPSKTSKKSSSTKQPSSKESSETKSLGKTKSMSLEKKTQQSKDVLATEKTFKRPKTSSRLIKKSSSSRRRSSVTSVNQKETIVEDTLSMPNILPEHNEAWKAFITDSDYHYNELKTQMDDYEKEGKELNTLYVAEIKKLQEIREFEEGCKQRLLKIQSQKQLDGKDDIDVLGRPVFLEQEKICHELIDSSEKEILEQKEKILGTRTELQLYLQLYQDKKKAIADNFEAFCSSNYKTLAPSFESIPGETELKTVVPNITSECLMQEESILLDIGTIVDEELYGQYEYLKNLMQREREKMLHEQSLNKQWIRSCKNE